MASDTCFFDVVATDVVGLLCHGGTTILHLLCGCTNLLSAGYAMTECGEIANTFKDLLDWKTFIEAAIGQQTDVSASERSGRVVGIAEHQGDALTFLDIRNITGHDEFRSALGDASFNPRAT